MSPSSSYPFCCYMSSFIHLYTLNRLSRPDYTNGMHMATTPKMINFFHVLVLTLRASTFSGVTARIFSSNAFFDTMQSCTYLLYPIGYYTTFTLHMTSLQIILIWIHFRVHILKLLLVLLCLLPHEDILIYPYIAWVSLNGFLHELLIFIHIILGSSSLGFRFVIAKLEYVLI